MAYIFIRVCALIYNGILPPIFARHLGHQYVPQTAEVIPHLHLDAVDTKQRCKCTAQIARATWRTDGTSAFTSANRRVPGVPERTCGADATLGQSPEHGLGVRYKAIQIAVFGARQFHSSAMSRRMCDLENFRP